MTVSVVIPALNEEKNIGRCLESLINQTVKPDEIIIVDNGSKDLTSSVVKTFKNVTLLTEKKHGTIFARNTGFNHARSDIIARTDADSIPFPNWIEKIKKDFETQNIIGVSGPVVYTHPIFSKFSFVNTIMTFKLYSLLVGHGTLFGPNMAILRTSWKKILGEVCLDGKLVHEDQDVAMHLARFGKILFDPKLLVYTSA